MRRGRRLPLEELQPYLVEVTQPRPARPVELSVPPPLSWTKVFGNDRPVEIEVGSGKGLFLLTAGLAHPDSNFLGIEIERKYALFTATRLAKRGLNNVKVASCDARWFLEHCVEAGSIRAIHVYFPDPWWKTRHRKRRVLTPDFLCNCARDLSEGGELHLATDVAEYFAETQKMLQTIPTLTPSPETPRDPKGAEFLTNFERKYRLAGKAIYRARYKKVGIR